MVVDALIEKNMYALDRLRKALEKPVLKMFGFVLIKHELSTEVQQLRIRVTQLEAVVSKQRIEEDGFKGNESLLTGSLL